MVLKILLGIIIALAIVLVVLYFLGKKAQKKQDETQAQINASAQVTSMLIIDKKKMRLKDANLPSVVLDNAPKLARVAKLPIVKAKIGPKVMTLLCDEKVFKELPIKRECKVTISGMYITGLKNVRGKVDATPEKKKKGLFRKK